MKSISKFPQTVDIAPIARVDSPYREKFGIPRQAGLVPAAEGALEMLPGYCDPLAFDGIEGFSHLWVIFGFHECQGQWRTRVRPPRLGGNKELGVFATRSPFRPNNLGLSVLRFDGLESDVGSLRLRVSGLDLQHGTPVYDIKPYVPYADSVPDALGGFAGQSPEARFSVSYSIQAEAVLKSLPDPHNLEQLITQSLALDPRPSYRHGCEDHRSYGMQVRDCDVRWRIVDDQIVVEEIAPTR